MKKITNKVNSITHMPKEYYSAICPAPKSVKIEMTAVCDFKCWFCATGQNLRKKSSMDWEFFKRIAKEMRDAGVEELGMFYLGESFLYKKLPEAIKYAKDEAKFPYVFLTANGLRATPDRVEEVIRAGLDSLKWSYNFSNKEDCIETTRVDAYDTVVENIKSAKEVRDKVYEETGHWCGLYASSIEVIPSKREEMEYSISLIEDYIDQHYWLPLYSHASLVDDQLIEHNTTPVAGNPGVMGNEVPALPCWSIFTAGHITYDGKLSACAFDHNSAFDMGDLNELSFMEAWNSEKFVELIKHHLKINVMKTACEGCIYNSPNL